MQQAEHVWFVNNMFMYLISRRNALAPHSTSSHCPLQHPQKKPRYSSISIQTEVQTCRSHYDGFPGTLNNYRVGVSPLSLVWLQQREWVVSCVGLEVEMTAFSVHVFVCLFFWGGWWKWGPVLERGERMFWFEAEQGSCQRQTGVGYSSPQPIRELFTDATANQVASWF